MSLGATKNKNIYDLYNLMYVIIICFLEWSSLIFTAWLQIIVLFS